jgi:hypothetical protein
VTDWQAVLAAAGFDPWSLVIAWLTFWILTIVHGLHCAAPLLAELRRWLRDR